MIYARGTARRRMSRPLLLLSGSVAVVALLAGCAQSAAPAGPGGPPGGIVGRGEGKVTGNPDTATLVLGVQTQAPSAQAALDANSGRANAVIAMLKGRGVKPEDIRTSELSISPLYGGTGKISGYQVSNQVTVTLRDIPAAGRIIDAAAAAAGDAIRVQQLSFSIADDSALRDQARDAAAKAAKAKAEKMAEALGVSLGPLISATESFSAPPMPLPYGAQAQSRAADVPVEPGTQQLSITVEAVYAIG
ncbi:MAG: SIMPL domain-containing protein [Pseudonocardia sp.]